MTRFEFMALAESLAAYYSAKTPGSKTIDLWFDMVQNIPAEALPWIEQKIYQEHDLLPRNLPKAIRELFEAWLQANPEKRAHKESVDCPDCEGGWLCLTRPVRGYKVPPTFSAPCGQCRRLRAGKYMTLSEAFAEGFKRQNLGAHTNAGARNVKTLAAQVGKEIPA